MNGSPDTGGPDWHNATVSLHFPGSPAAFCTATAITHSLIMTASHCVNCPNVPSGVVEIAFGPAVYGPHRITGRVIKSTPMATCPTAGFGSPNPVLDVAIIELDRAIPSGDWPDPTDPTDPSKAIRVPPVHPWELTSTCPDTFNDFYDGTGFNNRAMIAGFGVTDNVTTPAATQRMVSILTGSWPNTDPSAGRVKMAADHYVAKWAPLETYNGPLKGDSGGPIFFQPNGPAVAPLVCGVFSGFPQAPVANDPAHPDFPGTQTAEWSSVRSSGVIAFLSEFAHNSQWDTWRADCPGATTPAENGDDDFDGICNKLDNCPLVPNRDQLNGNEKAEEVSGLEKRGDACDSTVWTNFFQTADAYSPAPVQTPLQAALEGERLLDVDSMCIGGEVPPGKVSVAVDNVFAADSFPRVDAAGGQDGSTRVLRCKCLPTQDCLDQFGPNCRRLPSHPGLPNVSPPSSWKRVTLHQGNPLKSAFATDLAYGMAKDIPLAGVSGNVDYMRTLHSSSPAVNHARTWGWRYWADIPAAELPPLYQRPEGATAWEGQIWSYVHADRSFGSMTTSLDQIFPIPGVSGTLPANPDPRRSVIRRVALHENYTAIPPCTIPGLRTEKYVQVPWWGETPWGTHLIALKKEPRINPDPFWADITYGGGTRPTPFFTSGLASLMRAPSATPVFATDTAGPYHGIVVDGGAITAHVSEASATQLGAEAVASHAVSGTPAVSGNLQEARFFQAPTAAHATGSVQRYSLATRTSAVFDILGGQLGTPLSATYHPVQNAYYVLDELAGEIRIVRVDATFHAVVLGAWPKTGVYTDYAIQRDDDNALTVSSWSVTEHANVAFEVQTDGSLVAFARERDTGPLAGPSLRRGTEFHHMKQMGQIEELNVVSLFGGGGTSTADGVPATTARMGPVGGAFGPDGAFYYGDYAGGLGYGVRRIATDGAIATVAGHGGYGDTGDGGPALGAAFTVTSVAVGPDGSIYIADANASRVRRVSPAGTISTFAGTATPGFSGDGGLATAAQLSSPTDVAVGPDGSVYIADGGNYVVRRVATDGHISTFAGTPGGSALGIGEGDGGPATSARFVYPTHLAVSSSGVVYITDGYLGHVRRVDTSGVITLFAGGDGFGFSGDGRPAVAAALWSPTRLALAADGSVFIASGDHVRVVDPRGNIATFAGKFNDSGAACGDTGPARQTRFAGGGAGISGLALGPDGALYVADLGSCGLPARVRKISAIFPGGVTGAFQDKNVPVASSFTPGTVPASDVAQCF